MSDMIINDSVPVDKKWSELIRYNIFIMKLVEFVISLLITLLPMAIPKPHGHMYCISTGPTLVISFLFIILYLRKKVPLFMEKMYLFFQILFTFGAFVQCFLLNLIYIIIYLYTIITAVSSNYIIMCALNFKYLTSEANSVFRKVCTGHISIPWSLAGVPRKNKVMSMLLMIIPFILSDAGIVHCLAVAPTLVMSIMFVVLYLVDQVHNLAEQLYLLLQIILTIAAFVVVFLKTEPSAALYGLFYCHLLIALCIDQYYVIKERGCILFRDEE